MRRLGFSLVEVLVAVFVVTILIALLAPAIQAVRESSRRTVCASRLKQNALAIHAYHQTWSMLPAYGFGDPLAPKPSRFHRWGHSWRTAILPSLEQQNLLERMDLSTPPTDARNQAAITIVLPQFICPSTACQSAELSTGLRDVFVGLLTPSAKTLTDYDGALSAARADYDASVMVATAGAKPDRQAAGILWGTDGRRPLVVANAPATFATTTDGLSMTILLTERAGRPDQRIDDALGVHTPGQWQVGANGGAWAIVAPDPFDRIALPVHQPNTVNRNNCASLFSFHPHGINAAMGDASVRFLDDMIATDVLFALLSRDEADASAPSR